jgi:hypothetical protein
MMMFNTAGPTAEATAVREGGGTFKEVVTETRRLRHLHTTSLPVILGGSPGVKNPEPKGCEGSSEKVVMNDNP